MRIFFLLMMLCAFEARSAALGCGANVKTHDPAARIFLTADLVKTSDPFWPKHLMMLDAMELIPREIEMAFTPSAIKQGRYQTIHYLQQALNQAMEIPEANVSLRMLARLCQVIAEDAGTPQTAGDLFLSYMNQLPMDAEALLERRPVGEDEILRRVKAQTVFPYLPLSGMLDAKDVDFILAATYAGLCNLSYHLHPDTHTNSALFSALMTGINSLGLELATGLPVDGVVSELTFSSGRGDYVLKLTGLRPTEQGPTIIAPAIGSTMNEVKIPWATTVSWNGTPLGGAFNVSRKASNRLQLDVHLFERLMMPLLVRAGAYELVQFSNAVFFGGSEDTPMERSEWQRFSIFSGNTKLPADASTPQRYQAAIAQYLFSAISLGPANQTAINFRTSSIQLFFHHAHRGLTYADMELASRAYNLPIEIIACPEPPPRGLSRGYPWKPEGTPAPGHACYVVIDHPQVTKNLKGRWGLDDARNLELLRTDTGMFIQP